MAKEKIVRRITLRGRETPEELARIALSYQREMESGIEEKMPCGKCGKRVRVICEDSAPGGVSSDLEIKVRIYCIGGPCGWEVVQWRPWNRRHPEEL